MRIAGDEAWNCDRDDNSRRVAGLSRVAEPFFVCREGGLDQRVSRGLGLILARQISSEGGRVALLARDAGELERAKAELRARGGEVLALQCDLFERAQIQAAVAEVLSRYGKIDVLFNNAGIIQVGPVENMQQQDFERTMSVHFWA